jgi:hypothetical protein
MGATTNQPARAKKMSLYRNIHNKRKRIKAQKAAGKKTEKMRKPGSKGAPTAKAFKQAAKTANRPKKKTKRG